MSQSPSLRDLLSSFRRNTDSYVQHLITSQTTLLPEWKPHPFLEHEESLKPVLHRLQSLRLPAITQKNGELNKPNLLLHDLGGKLFDSLENRRRVKDLFGDGKHKLLVNPSGSGKTRIVLEGLCQHWGLYLTCQSIFDSSDMLSFGSTDISRIVTELPSQSSFTSFLPDELDSNSFRLLQQNWDITKHWFTAALLARTVLFHQFLNTAISETFPLGADLRRRWLLAQIQPITVFGSDILNSFTRDIGTTSSTTDIEATFVQIWGEVTTLLYTLDPSLNASKKPTIFVVIDEAQDGVSQLPQAFMSGLPIPSEETRKKRPVLRQLVFTLTSALHKVGNGIDFAYIVTGTGISRKMLEEAISSATYKEQKIAFIPAYNTGGFDYEKNQREYIAHYLGQDFPDSKIGKCLCSRMWHWLQGRYRFTAEFLALLIEDAFQRPNTLLNSYISLFGGFDPTDWNVSNSEFKEEAPKFSFSFSPLQFDKLTGAGPGKGQGRIAVIDSIAYPFFMRSLISGDSLGDEDQTFIECGVARWQYSKEKASYNCTISEPLVLLAAAVLISVRDGTPLYKRLTQNIDANISSKNRNGFEAYLAYFFARTFGKTERLGAVFDLQYSAAEALADYDATLVSLYRMHDDSPLVTQSIVLFPGRDNHSYVKSVDLEDVNTGFARDFGPVEIPGPLGEHVNSAEGMEDWLRHRTRTAFCYPPQLMGPDLMFVLRLTKPRQSSVHYIWVAVQAKLYRADKTLSLKAAKLKDAIRSVTPDRYFLNENDKEDYRDRNKLSEQKANQEHLEARDRVLNAMEDLENREPSAGPCGVLRVIASFPQHTKFSMVSEEQTSADRYPLSSLNREYLMARLQHINPTRYLARMDELDTMARRSSAKTAVPPVNQKTAQRLEKITPWTRKKSRIDIETAKLADIQDQIEYVRIHRRWKWVPPAIWRINGKECKAALSEFVYDMLQGKYTIKADVTNNNKKTTQDRAEILRRLVKRTDDSDGDDHEYNERVLALIEHASGEGEVDGDAIVEGMNSMAAHQQRQDVEMKDGMEDSTLKVDVLEEDEPSRRKHLKRKKRSF
ncbi:hypothetical protein K435DRAFT_842374 [Dendrothele bispora CBS 962.96]|uniref:Uncharacterized protein n=1 Tax=Dendrothele bispora (strain CBS 962.96) TaxID=1314807 RepID=A0A4S8LG90_DENBC|nr:hypothetical protein K435DRAFT_842374 [Dendrothele bispora CBS 962.96]